jgi:glycopeptide antibiotics resistance protein
VPAVRKLILFSVLIVPARILIVAQRPSPAEMIGAALGALASAQLRKPNRWITAVVFLVTIVLRGLTPFIFGPEARHFSWIPFGGFLDMEWQQGTIMLAEKFFWYGTAVWLLRRARLARPVSLALVAIILLAIEIAQIRIPGHVAEITDPILGLAAGWSVFVLSER